MKCYPKYTGLCLVIFISIFLLPLPALAQTFATTSNTPQFAAMDDNLANNNFTMATGYSTYPRKYYERSCWATYLGGELVVDGIISLAYGGWQLGSTDHKRQQNGAINIAGGAALIGLGYLIADLGAKHDQKHPYKRSQYNPHYKPHVFSKYSFNYSNLSVTGDANSMGLCYKF